MKIYIKKIIKTSRIDIFKKGGIYTFLNPVSYLQLRKTNLLDGFTGVFCDGGVLVKFINFFYREKLERFSFDDLLSTYGIPICRKESSEYLYYWL